MQIRGNFAITMQAEPPYDVEEGVSLGILRFDKTFEGPLTATSTVTMLGARTQVEGSAGYVALERVKGSVEGKHGTFVLQHDGLMNRGTSSLSVVVVPDSATGELVGLSGRMDIQIIEGQHHYTFDYELG